MEHDRILPGKLSITRPSAGDGREVIRFIIRDERSRSKVLTFDIEPREFALALTGLAEQPIGAMWTYLERLGKKMETKSEQIDTQGRLTHWGTLFDPQECLDLLKPYEIDGWQARASDINNPHCCVREGVQAVTFFRWVDVEPESSDAHP